MNHVISSALVVLSAAILFVLGAAHLAATFTGGKLLPREDDLQSRMDQVSPRITQETTMWRAWLGFNASHSIALLLFGSMYAYLALAHEAFLFDSAFLLGVGAIVLVSYVVLSKQFFFRFPLNATAVATLAYGFAIVLR